MPTEPDRPPFEEESRALAQQCFARFQTMTGRTLRADTHNADFEAYCLALTGFGAAIREAGRLGNTELAFQLGKLLSHVRRDSAFAWLSTLAQEETP